MKNKKINYVLLPLAVGIWGYAIYYFIGSGKTDSDIQPNGLDKSPVIRQAETTDTFLLLLGYADPFTKILKLPVSQTNLPKVTPPKKEKIEVPMPALLYKGFILGGKGEKTGIFRIEQKNVLLKEKEESNGIKVLTIAEAEAVVSWNNKKQTVPIFKKK